MKIEEAVSELQKQIGQQPWLVSIGIAGDKIIVYAKDTKAKVPDSCNGYEIFVQKMGTPKPTIAESLRNQYDEQSRLEGGKPKTWTPNG